jgi:hypothetical protein
MFQLRNMTVMSELRKTPKHCEAIDPVSTS